MGSSDRQHRMTDGLIIREYPTIAESDRFVAILTRDLGVVRASARGARNARSRLGAATQLLCYARLSLIPAKDKYIIEDAKPQEVFFSLRQDVERLAIAQYFCELALHQSPTDAPAEEHLRLFLNGLHYLGDSRRDPRVIKAVVEARLLRLEGYMPDLGACAHCGAAESEPYWLSPSAGVITCDDCRHESDAIAMSPSVLAAMRHVMGGDFERCFAFSLPPAESAAFADLVERFLLAQIGRRFTTLEFYHTLT